MSTTSTTDAAGAVGSPGAQRSLFHVKQREAGTRSGVVRQHGAFVTTRKGGQR